MHVSGRSKQQQSSNATGATIDPRRGIFSFSLMILQLGLHLVFDILDIREQYSVLYSFSISGHSSSCVDKDAVLYSCVRPAN